MTMTDERLAKLDAVMAKATAGEWEWRNDQLLPLSDQWTISPGVLIADSNNGTPGGDEIDRANAAAIVALHNAYPDLRALIEAQAATIARGLSIHEREALCGAFLTTTVEAGKCYATLKVKDVTTLHNLHDALIALRAALTGAA